MSGPTRAERRRVRRRPQLQPHLNPADKISKFGGVSLAGATRTGPPFEARFDAYPQDHRPVVPTVASGLILTEPLAGTATAGVML